MVKINREEEKKKRQSKTRKKNSPPTIKTVQPWISQKKLVKQVV